jgi:hypothetical protein
MLAFESQPRWPSFAASVGLHLALILALPYVTESLQETPEKVLAARNERILKTIRIRIPEQLYLATSGPAARRERPVVFKAPAARPEGASGQAKQARQRRRFELPPVPQQADSDQSLLQPRHQLSSSAGLRLPELFFWSPPPPGGPVKPFVQPGHLQPPSQPARLDTAPRLDVPGVFAAALATPAAPVSPGALTLPPPPSLPIRTSISDEQTPSGAATDRIQGDPANVLALSASSLPLREYVSVPPGSQVGRTPGAVPGGTLAGAAEEGAGGSSEAGSGLGSGSGGTGAGGTGAGGAASPPRVLPAAGSALAIEATRKEYPTNGVFDIVVQSAGPEGMQESAGVLTGKPVYSVYLQVGGRKEWILQYCVPASDVLAPAVSGSVVRLGGPARLSAPFPLVTYRPPLVHGPGKYLMLHGFINPQGRFQELRAIGAHDLLQAELAVGVLSRWEFRPASHGGKPVRVEMLLAIPGE